MEMARYVLFSPVGMTDPISDFHDGSMLHIARKYRPERVYIYLSQETAAFDKKDGRYAKALELLARNMNFPVKVTKILRPELVDVHLFDEFYDEFEEIIKKIKYENPGAVILLNVSSGTPAMKSALHTIAAMTDDAECIPIQVATPRKAHNERRESVADYELEVQWECNEDNDEEKFFDRCSCSKHYNLLLKIKKEIIRNHIDAYDYRAALAIADDCGRGVNGDAKNYLRAACARVQLDTRGTDAALSGASAEALAAFVPIREGDKRSMAEYLLWLEVKLKRKEFCDFIRGISPLFLDLLEAAEKKCGININAYCNRDQKGKKRLMRSKMEVDGGKGARILSVLDPIFYGCYRDSNLSSAQLAPLVEHFVPDEGLKSCVQKLRNIEDVCRNRAAHEIISVTDDWIKREGGLSPEEILSELGKLSEYIGISRSRIKGSYEKMNDFIKQSLA